MIGGGEAKQLVEEMACRGDSMLGLVKTGKMRMGRRVGYKICLCFLWL